MAYERANNRQTPQQKADIARAEHILATDTELQSYFAAARERAKKLLREAGFHEWMAVQ